MSFLYLDMDGVVADFEGGLRARGLNSGAAGNYHHLPKEHWTAEQIDHDITVCQAMNDNDFWSGLQPFPDTLQFYNEACRIAPYKVKFLTALPSNPERANPVAIIKRAWLWRYLRVRPYDVITCLRSEKKLRATPTSILVDDMPPNCNEWVKAGGHAILHTDFQSSLDELENTYVRCSRNIEALRDHVSR